MSTENETVRITLDPSYVDANGAYVITEPGKYFLTDEGSAVQVERVKAYDARRAKDREDKMKEKMQLIMRIGYTNYANLLDDVKTSNK
ncbi:MAG: hypothetical protein Sylvanvirus28_12 [Sylvanvirus sp.]|uniref:Uncharacterized protein n=1 Tax=Sylvanvirus sp. TaxID=2487774 RepID=A0A3G5AJ22_9VIRU|nr:MAG: hypothetical protein Sylvanvirus28_12 [Sylvanvirus sp.]